MQERYRMFRRDGGNFYARVKVTGKSESLEIEINPWFRPQ